MFPQSTFPQQKHNDSENRDRMSVQLALASWFMLGSAWWKTGIFTLFRGFFCIFS